jgi:cutinase
MSISYGIPAFKQAAGCRAIVAGGYTQGAAVMHNVMSKSLVADLKGKIKGVAIFGDTRNLQDSGHTQNSPKVCQFRATKLVT